MSIFPRRLRSFAAGIGLVLLTTAPAPAATATSSAPMTTSGAVFDLEQLRGQVVYLDFWASWCGPCRQSFPWMNDLQKNLSRDGLVVVAVNVDHERADADRFLYAYAPAFQVVYDPQGSLAEHWHVKGMPTSVLIGRDGKPVLVHQGFHLADRAELEGAVRSALAAH